MHAALFSQFLVSEGVLPQSTLMEVRSVLRNRNKSLGQLAIESNLLSERQVAELNREQRTTDLRLGELAIRQNLLTEDDLERLLILQQATQVSLGQILVEKRLMSKETLHLYERSYRSQQLLTRKLCEEILFKIPQSESIQLCLNELIKGLQRICRQVVSVNAVQQNGQLQKALPYIVLQKISGPRSFYFGLAVPAEQVRRFSCSLSGEPESQGYIPVAAMVRFSDIVVKNACEKLGQQDGSYSAEKPKAFFIGDRLPAYKDMVGVQLQSEEGAFDAVFFGH